VRLGIFGGTFDPPHMGHLLAASDAFEALSLDLLLFVPNAQQPLRGLAHASGEDRLNMVRLLVNGDPRFGVDEVELNRKGLSFTVDTLEALARRYPGSNLMLLVGEDAALNFQKWRNPERVLQLASLILLTRNTASVAQEAVGRSGGGDLLSGAVTVPSRRVDISSSEIRQRRALGLSITGFVNESVQKFIEQRGLYSQVRE
jgi:nicotinate-nucleotide adenylyltransferase